MQIVSVVGRKNSGKTSLTVKIIEELKNRGYKVASIKHSHHQMEMDRENTDTWKHRCAGSDVVVGVGATTFFNVRKLLDLDRLLFLIKTMETVDFVIIEGFKSYPYPKIATTPDVVDEFTIAEVDAKSISQEGLEEVVDMIEEKGCDIIDTLFHKTCGYNEGLSIAKDIIKGNIKIDELDKTNVSLAIDGKIVGLNSFVSDFIEKITLGLIKTLNTEQYNVKDFEKIDLVIANPNLKENIISLSDTTTLIKVNDKEIAINKFVENYIKNAVEGLVKSLKLEDYNIESLEKIETTINSIESGNVEKAEITLAINNKPIEINTFVCRIMKESIFAMVKSLDTDFNIEDIYKIELKIILD